MEIMLKNKNKNIILDRNRDHRIIGKKLNFYHINDNSPGMVFWHSDGLIIFRLLKDFIRKKLLEYDYREVQTPILLDETIWKKSGHWENYKNSIFTTASENRKYCIKPMNCPGHVEIFNQGLKSYKDLPFRISEFGSCHRKEPSGSMHGLMRVRYFTQDDAHIFCSEEQVQNEIETCIMMIFDIYKIFGFKEIYLKLSTRPINRIGSNENWDRAELDLLQVLKRNNLKFEYQLGEGAFYGPKIELILKDSLNRMWQCGTIQLDFYLSSKLNSFYINKKNQKKNPIIIHRAILGSIERFIGILIEEYSGFLPTWLSPLQIVIISVHPIHSTYVEKLKNKIFNLGIRVKSDVRNIKINIKIKNYTISRIPYIFICGDKEIKKSKVTVRTRLGKNFDLVDFNSIIKKIQFEIFTYSNHCLEE